MNAQPSRMFVTSDGRNVLVTFCLISVLFLLWGFCNGMIDVMDKHFQERLHLTIGQSAWIQFAHYLGYFLMALPAGALAQQLGYRGGIIAGLLTVAVGGFWFLAAVEIETFWAFLLGVCIIASGLCFLETVANPYATVLGAERYAASRINLAQSCNGIGWVFGPIVGSIFFYSSGSGASAANESLHIPYVGVAMAVLVLAFAFLLAPVPDIRASAAPDERRENDGPSIWIRPHFTMAVVAQFLYVAAQASIFSFFINYMTSQPPAVPETWASAYDAVVAQNRTLATWISGWLQRDLSGNFNISNKGAANLASLAFIFFLLGRIIGAVVMRRAAPNRVLALFGVMNVLTNLLIFAKLGWLSALCVFPSYFFMSIMFPTIFALGIEGLGAQTKRASAYLVMAIVGGAVVPKITGYIADRFDMSRSFIVPMICFGFIAFYGLGFRRLRCAAVMAQSDEPVACRR